MYFGYLNLSLRAPPPAAGPSITFWHHFGTCGGLFASILGTKWGKDALRETLMGPRIVFLRFLMDFGVPAGVNLD